MNRFSAACAAPLILIVALSLTSAPSVAQEPAATASAQEGNLRVYLDCATRGCRQDRFRQDINWVSWVREPQDAQVYILMTGQPAGSGGWRYVFDFEGRGELSAVTDQYTHTSSGTDVEEEVALALTRTLGVGLVRFMGLAGMADRIEVSAAEVAAVEREQRGSLDTPQDDPWDYWVFSLRANAELEREDREKRDEYRFNLSANRTTDTWKVDLGGNFNYSRREVEFDDGDTFIDERDDWGARGLVVRSLTPHWSVGFLTTSGSSVRFNRDFNYEFSPAVEWNYFPWQESTRRRFVFLYTIGLEYFDYDEVTIYDKLEETLFQQRFDVQFRIQESWGNANFGAEARQYLQHPSQYSFEFDAELDYRLARGLSFNIGAGYEVIHDQRYLSGEGLTPEEILTSRRALATGSRTSLELGVSYRFGSIFNNIVNARFPGMGGFRGFF